MVTTAYQTRHLLILGDGEQVLQMTTCSVLDLHKSVFSLATILDTLDSLCAGSHDQTRQCHLTSSWCLSVIQPLC